MPGMVRCSNPRTPSLRFTSSYLQIMKTKRLGLVWMPIPATSFECMNSRCGDAREVGHMIGPSAHLRTRVRRPEEEIPAGFIIPARAAQISVKGVAGEETPVNLRMESSNAGCIPHVIARSRVKTAGIAEDGFVSLRTRLNNYVCYREPLRRQISVPETCFREILLAVPMMVLHCVTLFLQQRRLTGLLAMKVERIACYLTEIVATAIAVLPLPVVVTLVAIWVISASPILHRLHPQRLL